MAEKQYSRVCRYNKRRFRYNFENHTLEWIDKDNSVIDLIGLSSAPWKESPQTWVEEYSRQIDEELYWLMK